MTHLGADIVVASPDAGFHSLNTTIAKNLYTVRLPGTPWTLTGSSDSNQVGFFIGELNVKLDAGIPTDSQYRYTFLTSKNRNSICELPSDFLESSVTSTVHTMFPKDIEKFVASSLGVTKHQSTAPVWDLVKVVPDESFSMTTASKVRLVIEPIRSTCDSIGYGFVEVRSKLKTEFMGMPQDEIDKMFKTGTKICEDRSYPHFCYFGVVDYETFMSQLDKLTKYSIIIVPCYLLEDDAAKFCWPMLEVFVMSHPEITFILHGFDAKYDDASVFKFFMPIANVVPFKKSYRGCTTLNKFIDSHVKRIVLPNTPYSIMGSSEAARHTGFYIPELGINLDAGVPTDNISEHIFISHGHWDHMRNLPCMLTKMPEICKNVYVPGAPSNCERIRNFVRDALCSPPNWNLVPMSYDDCQIITVQNKLTGKDVILKVEPFKCTHSCPCLGFGFIELDSETGVETPLFCFLGDTDHRVLSTEEPKLLKYQTIIIECTFINPDELKKAKKDKHMHWKNLANFVARHSDITFILYHFSCRYKSYEIQDHFLTVGLSNVIPFAKTTTS